jgi:seryl-tRNA(Sec) selenium transferase
MKVGKEGIIGLMAALEAWTARDAEEEKRRLDRVAGVLAAKLATARVGPAHRIDVRIDGISPQAVANVLREGGIWVRDAFGATLVLDLRRLNEQEAAIVADRIRAVVENRVQPKEDVPYHDLYRSRERLLRWPD